jgi:hypothetical protein
MQEVAQRETGALIEGKHTYESITHKIASVAMGYRHPLA